MPEVAATLLTLLTPAPGAITFLHTNMPPKWNLDVVTEPSRYLRRWEWLDTPGEPWPETSIQLFGCVRAWQLIIQPLTSNP